MESVPIIDKTKLRDEVVKDLLSRYHFITIIGTEELYVYDDGIYINQGVPEKIFKDATQTALGENCTKFDVNEVIATIQRKSFVDSNFFEDTPTNLIPTRNGILDINSKAQIDFSPNYHFLNKIELAWGYENASCPAIEKFLGEIFTKPEDILAIYEFAGYCLYRDYPIHRAFMFLGEGSNGKSTLLELLKRFLGAENVSNISLQDLSNRFAIAELRNKMGNFYADLEPERALKETGNFKMLTGNDSFSPELKFVQRRVPFKNVAKFAFSCNKIPENRTDDTLAFWRRWVIFSFTRVFEGANCDPNLLEKLTDKDELDGFFVQAIEGLQRLLKNGKFSNDRGSEITRKIWIRSDSIRAFTEERIEVSLTEFVTKEAVYSAYTNFCLENELTPLDKIRFGLKFKNVIGYRDGQRNIDGVRHVWCYVGLKLKPKVEKSQLELESNAD